MAALPCSAALLNPIAFYRVIIIYIDTCCFYTQWRTLSMSQYFHLIPQTLPLLACSRGSVSFPLLFSCSRKRPKECVIGSRVPEFIPVCGGLFFITTCSSYLSARATLLLGRVNNQREHYLHTHELRACQGRKIDERKKKCSSPLRLGGKNSKGGRGGEKRKLLL